MEESPKRVGIAVTVGMLLLVGVLILQALGYGIGFFLDPMSGVGEFASPPPAGGDELTVPLVGLVGVAMLGSAGLLALSAFLIWRGDPAGASIGMVVGATYVLAGISVVRAGWTWDASFYIGGGGLLLLLSSLVRRLQRREGELG